MTDLDDRLRDALLQVDTDSELNARLAIAQRFGNDHYGEGTVIRFQKELPSRITRGNFELYTFAAIKANSRWYLTTQADRFKPMTWRELLLFLVSGDRPTTRFTQMTPLVGVGTREDAVAPARVPDAPPTPVDGLPPF